jgi:hypothetical protein
LLRRARFAIRATRLDASLVLHVHSMPAIEAVAHVVQTIPNLHKCLLLHSYNDEETAVQQSL